MEFMVAELVLSWPWIFLLFSESNAIASWGTGNGWSNGILIAVITIFEKVIFSS